MADTTLPPMARDFGNSSNPPKPEPVSKVDIAQLEYQKPILRRYEPKLELTPEGTRTTIVNSQIEAEKRRKVLEIDLQQEKIRRQLRRAADRGRNAFDRAR